MRTARLKPAQSSGHRMSHQTRPAPFIFSFRQILFLSAHVPLALLIFSMPALSSFYAWTTIAIFVLIALKSPRAEMLVYMASYVAGCEILWRMTEAQIFWETGKYLIILIFGIGLLRFRSNKSALLPVIYFCLLLPSALIPLLKLGPLEFKDAISFNLSGPLAFTICAIFFARLWLRERDLQRILVIMIGPIIGIATLTLYTTLVATERGDVFHGTESLFVASAGFGPNQVSAVLGLAGLLCYLLFLTNQSAGFGSKAVLIGAWILFTLESALTYSRGGIYMELAAAAVASFYAFRQKVVRASLFALLLFLTAVASFIVVPYLDSVSSGSFSDRYSSVDPTGRDVLIMDDLNGFARSPLYGVGVGMSEYFRTVLRVTAHTEYTRLLGEHGMLGVIALGLFSFMLYHRWKDTHAGKPILTGFLLWGLLFLAIYATRMVAPVFLMAFSFATYLSDENLSIDSEQELQPAENAGPFQWGVRGQNVQTFKIRES